MKWCLPAFVFIVLLSMPVFGANITLTYSECKIVANDTYCAPPDRTLNESAIYKQCIADFNANLAGLNSTFTSYNSSVVSSLGNVSASLSGLSGSVGQLKGIEVAGSYVSCLLDLNVSKNDARRWKGEAEQRQSELSHAKDGLVPLSDVELKQQEVNALKVQSDAKKDDLRNGAIIGVVIAFAGVYWYQRRSHPSSELDSRGSRAPRPGRI